MPKSEKITVHVELLQETQKAILVRCDPEADGVWIPKKMCGFDGGEQGDIIKITMSKTFADEKGFIDGMSFTPKNDATSDVAENNETEPPEENRSFGDNVKWVKKEPITFTANLSETERASYATSIAELDREIEALEDERSAISSSLKKQIDAKEAERRALSRIIRDGEERTVQCDCLKDYATEDMVWTETMPPYNEILRRKMTAEERRHNLLEFDGTTNDTDSTSDVVDDTDIVDAEYTAVPLGLPAPQGELPPSAEDVTQ